MTPDHVKIQSLTRENKDLRAAIGQPIMQKQKLMAALDKRDAAAASALQREFEGRE